MKSPLLKTALAAVAVVAAATMLTSGCSLLPAQSPFGTKTTVILVRHAERDPGADPPLNAEGQVRAQALLAALSDAGITEIYCTDLIRNRTTAQPLADKFGLELHLVSESKYEHTAATADELVQKWLSQHAGGVVLWVGNIGSSQFPNEPGINQEIFARLGGTGNAPIRYEDLFIMTIRDVGPPRVIKAKYGGKSSLDPA